MKRVFLFFIIITCISSSLMSQPKLRIRPDQIKFRDLFQRMQEVLFINEGDAPLTIDSLTYYNSYFYFIRFNKPGSFPYTIQPDDTLKMDCILSQYLYITQNDTLDTMFVYNNGVNPLEDVRIKIDFYDDNFRPGVISGTIRYNNIPQTQVNLHFYYEGKYEFYKAVTNSAGYYNVLLPPGNYLVAAEKDSFYTTFYGGSSDPFEAGYVTVGRDSISNADINLIHLPASSSTISGTVLDQINFSKATRGIVVIRKGTHTPDKVGVDTLQQRVFTAVVQDNGTYTIKGITQPGYYYLEAFSDFYLPGYYSSSGNSPVFWQNADSVYINTSLSNMNFELSRDSATGAGRVTGQIFNNLPGVETVIYARSIDFNKEFTHAISKSDDSFDLKDLPYGNYVLIAQQIGRNDTYSDTLHITPAFSFYQNINLNFNTNITKDEDFILKGFSLAQNYPNPFNPSTKIVFSVAHREKVFLAVYNLLGEQVSVLADGVFEQGTYTFNFKPGSNMSSGVYFYRIQVGTLTSARKMIFLK